MLCVQSRRTCCIDFYSMPSESTHKRWIRVTIILDSSSSSFPFLLAIIMELFLIARWLAFELVVVGVSSSPFFVCCVRFGHDVCSVEEEKGTSSHSGNGQHPGDQSNSRRLGWCCTTHSIRFPYSLLFSPIFSFLIWVLHMIYKSHSTLLYHVVYYLELLNGHGRAAGQERKMPSDCHFLFEWLAPLCLSIRVRIKNRGISKREKKRIERKKT